MFMGERLFFSRLVTKDLTAVDSNRRLFEGVLTVEMKDKQNEITIRDELLKVLPVWMARGSPITDTHSNRVIGKGINFASTSVTDSDGNTYPAITIQGEIFKDYELDDEIWKSIKNGKYKGLSFGGATKSNRRPVQQPDGSIAYALKDLEHYEVAVCEEPAVPLALITQHNELAKAVTKAEDRGNGTMCIRCTKYGCYVDKKDTYNDPNDLNKNGEEYSDVMGANVPEGRDEQGEAFKRKEDGEVKGDEKSEAFKSSYGDYQDNKQDDEKSEELEAQISQGPNQDNGATYHGTSKGRSVGDSARYAEVEHADVCAPPETPHVKAEDEDNKEALEEADLTEEKKLEYADGGPEGPETKKKISDPNPEETDPKKIMQNAESAGRGNYDMYKTDEIKIKKPSILTSEQEYDKHIERKRQLNDKAKATIELLNLKLKVGKLPAKRNVARVGLKESDLDSETSNAHAEEATRTRMRGLEGDFSGKIESLGNPKMAKALNELYKLSPHYVSEGSEYGSGKKPWAKGNRTTKEPKGREFEAGQKQPKGKPYPKNDNRAFNPSPGFAGGGSGKDRHTKPSKSPKPKAPSSVPFGDKERASLDAVRSKLGIPGPSSASSTSLGYGVQGGTPLKKPKARANPSMSTVLARTNPAKIGKALEIIESLKKKAYLDRRKEADQDLWKGGEVSTSSSWSEPARGGFAGSEPGETRDDEGRSHHDVDQPKHVNRPTNAEGADGVKKKIPDLDEHTRNNIDALRTEYADAESHGLDKPSKRSESCNGSHPPINKESRDPQMQGNNSEDGINGKLRTNQDDEAEAFQPTDDFDSSTAGSIGPQDVVRQEKQSEGLKKEQTTTTIDAKKRPKQVIHAEATTDDSYKAVNPAGWEKGESTQKPGVHPATDEHHAMVMGKVPASRISGSRHNSRTAGISTNSDPSELEDQKGVAGGVISQQTAQADKSTGMNDPGMGSGGIRSGAAYDNAQQDTSAKDQPRKVVEEDYTGMTDSDNGGDNQEFNKAMVDLLHLKVKIPHI